MIKKIVCGIALAAGLVSCSEDFTDWVNPQSNEGNESVEILKMAVTPSVSALNFATEKDDTLQLFTTDLEPGLTDGYVVSVAGENPDKQIEFETNTKGKVAAQTIKDAVAALYGKAPSERTLTVTVSTIATHKTTDGDVKVMCTGTPFTLKATLDAPIIAKNYYLVGGPNSDWKGSAVNKVIKFMHSDKDVYEDPVFTVVFDAAASGDTWFAFGDDEACEAIAKDDWSKLFGVVGGNNTQPAGQMDTRSQLGADNSFCVPAGAKKIKLAINMLERSYEITQVDIAEAYYLVGGPNDWEQSAINKVAKFSHSDQNVFDDPVFTYVLPGSGSEMWFAFGDAEACEAVAKGDWSKLFGTKGDSKDLKGSFDRRFNLDGDHSICVDGKAKSYRISINMALMTYEITPIDL